MHFVLVIERFFGVISIEYPSDKYNEPIGSNNLNLVGSNRYCNRSKAAPSSFNFLMFSFF